MATQKNTAAKSTKEKIAKKAVKAKPRQVALKRSTKVGHREVLSINPATLEKIGRVPEDDIRLMPQRFEKARVAQKQWAALTFKERAKHLKKMRRYIVDHAEELAQIVSRENGKTRTDALATEVIPCALAASWYAKHTQHYLKPQKLKTSSILFFNKRSEIHRLPLGVVGIISPWNYPLSIPFGEICMALMAGNAILLKVAAVSVMTGKAIEKIIEAGRLPNGLFQHIVGSGSSIAASFFENRIDKLFFTGSVATGKKLMAAAAATLTPLSLELGGKDPMIVMPDADLERAANAAAWAGYQNAGQSCGGVERIYAHVDIYYEFVALLAQKTGSLRYGYDDDFDVDMGSMTTAEQLAIVKEHVNDAVKRGGKIVVQSVAKGKTKGHFYPATLMTGVDHNMKLMRDETFGPILPVMKFHTIEEAIQLANDSTMALTSSVFTRNRRLGKKIASQLHSGVTTINDHLYTHGLSETPWGGWKESGLGRTHSALGIIEMTHTKVINWDILNTRRNLWWYPFNPETYQALLSALNFVYPKSVFKAMKDAARLTIFMIRKMFTPWRTK